MNRLLRDIHREVEYTRNLIGKDALDASVTEAVGKVPRHEFIPPDSRAYAYENGPISIGYGQTISQPYIVALMTDLLNTEPDDTILEVGSGSGYQAAILSCLVRRVYTVEIVPELASQAEERLRRLNYTNVEIKVDDGYFGWPEHAPFDGIVVTAAAPHIPQPLIDQLKVGARLVIPVGLPYMHQELMMVEKKENGAISTRDVLGVVFVPLTGKHE
jgi:protein-L-isoaspartate(D-aspartate) O-methyltransferase